MRSGFLLCLTVLMAGVIGTAVAAEGVTTLRMIDQQIGTAAVARDGSEVVVNYNGWLYDEDAPDHHGTKVDSSVDRGQPISFTLGEGKVIAGWDKGIKGMRVGGRRTLLIPARLAYGSRRAGKLVPPNAALVFDIALLAVH